jgi:hypothetical protein
VPLFPKVTSPCPYKSQLAAVMDGDFCRMCRRQVFDLSAFGDDERRAFLAGCADEVCVSYKVPIRSAIAAAALAASAVATPAMAQEQPTASPAAELDSGEDLSDVVIIVGGIRNAAEAEFVEVPVDESVPELPVVYEDEEAESSTPVKR